MKRTALMILVLLTVLLALAACDSGNGAMPPPSDTGPRPTPPPEYAGKTNPHAGDQASITAGKDLYAINCASCHGERGLGDGPTAASLDPKPKSLASDINALTDDYLLWRISEGGAFPPFNSAMPAWKVSLGEDQVWQIVSFLRTLAP